MGKKIKKTQIIKFNDYWIVVQAETDRHELSVLMAALKHYGNGYGLALLKRLEKVNPS